MNTLIRYILRKICQRFVIQGYGHKENITEYYAIMREAARKEFAEDNEVTLDAFLRECHENNSFPQPKKC